MGRFKTGLKIFAGGMCRGFSNSSKSARNDHKNEHGGSSTSSSDDIRPADDNDKEDEEQKEPAIIRKDSANELFLSTTQHNSDDKRGFKSCHRTSQCSTTSQCSHNTSQSTMATSPAEEFSDCPKEAEDRSTKAKSHKPTSVPSTPMLRPASRTDQSAAKHSALKGRRNSNPAAGSTRDS
jgi:hypothetical protein